MIWRKTHYFRKHPYGEYALPWKPKTFIFRGPLLFHPYISEPKISPFFPWVVGVRRWIIVHGFFDLHHRRKFDQLRWIRTLAILQEISGNRTHGPRTPTPEYLIARSFDRSLLRGPLGFGPIRCLMDIHKITHLQRKMIFQTSMIVFHVNLPGCIHKKRRFFTLRIQTPSRIELELRRPIPS